MSDPMTPERRTFLRVATELGPRMHPDAVVLELLDEVDRLEQLTAACVCTTSGPDYEGPSAECPVHGAVRAYDKSQVEVERLRTELATSQAEVERLRTEWDNLNGMRLDERARAHAAETELAKTRTLAVVRGDLLEETRTKLERAQQAGRDTEADRARLAGQRESAVRAWKDEHDALDRVTAELAKERVAHEDRVDGLVKRLRAEYQQALDRIQAAALEARVKATDIDLIRLAISDPGAFVKRERRDSEDRESIPAWGARAVVAALQDKPLELDRAYQAGRDAESPWAVSLDEVAREVIGRRIEAEHSDGVVLSGVLVSMETAVPSNRSSLVIDTDQGRAGLPMELVTRLTVLPEEIEGDCCAFHRAPCRTVENPGPCCLDCPELLPVPLPVPLPEDKE